MTYMWKVFTKSEGVILSFNELRKGLRWGELGDFMESAEVIYGGGKLQNTFMIEMKTVKSMSEFMVAQVTWLSV